MQKHTKTSDRLDRTGREIHLFLLNRREEKAIDTETEIEFSGIHEYRILYSLSINVPCIVLNT